MDFSQEVDLIRKQRNLTFDAMAKELNIYILDPRERYTGSAIWLWVSGQHVPYHSRMKSVAEIAPDGSWQKDLAVKCLRQLEESWKTSSMDGIGAAGQGSNSSPAIVEG
jgi:transcriptional regulator with XRE-family HTH domain